MAFCATRGLDNYGAANGQMSLQTFVERGMHIGEESLPGSTFYHADRSIQACDPAPQDIQDRLWRVVREQVPTLQGESPATTMVGRTIINSVFSPLIPDSIVFELAAEESTAPFMKICATIVLIFEAVFRELTSVFISWALSAYSMYNPDYATYYQFCLDLNRHHPTNYLANRVILPLIGRY